MFTSNYILFRRTLIAAGALALSVGNVPAFGATAVLGSASCAYNGMTIDPAGNITINCDNSTPTLAQFVLTGPSSLAVGAAGAALVSRAGGPASSLTVNYSAAGECTVGGTGSLTFAQGAAAQSIPITAGAAAGTCTIAITAPAGGHTTVPAAGFINVSITTGSGGEGPPPPPGCPTPQADYKLVQLGWSSAPSELRMASGVIASFPIPAPQSTKASIRLSQGQTPVSPGGTSELFVSKCPGVIDQNAGSCYRSVPAGNYTSSPDAYTKVVYGWDTQAKLDPRSSCLALASEGQWYVNVRWNYTTNNCPWGCGYSMQWFPGSY